MDDALRTIRPQRSASAARLGHFQSVHCPRCGAEAGKPCQHRYGLPRPMRTVVHGERIAAWAKEN